MILKIGNRMNLVNKKSSTKTKSQNKMVLDTGFNHKKYSIKSVKNKYKIPNERNKIHPLINSLV
jgi:hypothetical protein